MPRAIENQYDQLLGQQYQQAMDPGAAYAHAAQQQQYGHQLQQQQFNNSLANWRQMTASPESLMVARRMGLYTPVTPRQRTYGEPNVRLAETRAQERYYNSLNRPQANMDMIAPLLQSLLSGGGGGGGGSYPRGVPGMPVSAGNMGFAVPGAAYGMPRMQAMNDEASVRNALISSLRGQQRPSTTQRPNTTTAAPQRRSESPQRPNNGGGYALPQRGQYGGAGRPQPQQAPQQQSPLNYQSMASMLGGALSGAAGAAGSYVNGIGRQLGERAYNFGQQAAGQLGSLGSALSQQGQQQAPEWNGGWQFPSQDPQSADFAAQFDAPREFVPGNNFVPQPTGNSLMVGGRRYVWTPRGWQPAG